MIAGAGFKFRRPLCVMRERFGGDRVQFVCVKRLGGHDRL